MSSPYTSMLTHFHRQIDTFTAEPINQWIEITDSVNMLSFNPIWFAEHRVYQFPVMCLNSYHSCDVKINDKTIFQFAYGSNLIENPQLNGLNFNQVTKLLI